jgi:hypothetical protein
VLERFFKRQIEECRELARHAVDEQDRAFWQQAAAHWEAQLGEFVTKLRFTTKTVRPIRNADVAK